MRSNAFIGIDLGTTNCAVAIAKINPVTGETAITPIQIDQIDPNGSIMQLPTLPSVTLLPDKPEDPPLVGFSAFQADVSDRRISLIKNKMGSTWTFEHQGKIWTPASISALYLSHLLEQAENSGLGYNRNEGATVTVPASFTPGMIKATREACELAGLAPEGTAIIHEPIAALLTVLNLWEQKHRDNVLVQRGILNGKDGVCRLLVFDIGGGTVDVAIVEVRELLDEKLRYRLRPDSLAISPHALLGGHQFDRALSRMVAARLIEQQVINAEQEPELFRRRWHRDMEQLKKNLCNRVAMLGIQDPEVTFKLSVWSLTNNGGRDNNRSWQGKVSYSEMVKAWDGLLGRGVDPLSVKPDDNAQGAILDKATSIIEPLAYVMHRVFGGWQPDLVHGVVLVGGMGAVPAVKERLTELFGPDKMIPLPNVDTSLAIATGAALHQLQVASGSSLLVSLLPALELQVRKQDIPAWIELIPRGQRVGYAEQFVMETSFGFPPDKEEIWLPMRVNRQPLGMAKVPWPGTAPPSDVQDLRLRLAIDPLRQQPEITVTIDGIATDCTLDENAALPMSNGLQQSEDFLTRFKTNIRNAMNRTDKSQTAYQPSELAQKLNNVIKMTSTADPTQEIARIRRCLIKAVHWDQPAAWLTAADADDIRAFCRAGADAVVAAYKQFSAYSPKQKNYRAALLSLLGAMKGMLPREHVDWLSELQVPESAEAVRHERLLALGRTLNREKLWRRLMMSYQLYHDCVMCKGHLLWALSRSYFQADLTFHSALLTDLETNIVHLIRIRETTPQKQTAFFSQVVVFLFVVCALRAENPGFLADESKAHGKLLSYIRGLPEYNAKVFHGANAWVEMANLLQGRLSMQEIDPNLLAIHLGQ